ncbi:MAG: zinc-dependent dehydrogenase [Anaerolineales bacterium]|nr:zinc-dependent dehydrogenase [Anaerolineales bacterium]MDW8162186.1 zinc-dependent dehydrogenase [Anaerolineales bacterium]
MKAAVFHNIGDLRVEEVPTPVPGPDQLLIKIGAAGICGTDLRILSNGHHRIPSGTPRVLGHEFSGEVVEVGRNVAGIKVGTRVAIAPNIGCGTCDECVAGWTNLCENYQAFGITLDGAFAEYMLVTSPAIEQGNIIPIPSTLPYEVAALAEPLSCCINGQEAVGTRPGDFVLIIGSGPIGIMHLLLSKLYGASYVVVSEINPLRAEQALRFGADVWVNPQREDLKEVIWSLSGGRGADVVIVAASSAALQAQAIEVTARRGRVNFFGGLPKNNPTATLNTNLIHYRQITVTGSTGANVRQFRTAVKLLVHSRLSLEGLVGACLPLDQVLEGFERTKQAQEMRILVTPNTRSEDRQK